MQSQNRSFAIRMVVLLLVFLFLNSFSQNKLYQLELFTQTTIMTAADERAVLKK